MTERIDDIGFGGLKLIQDPEEFCYGVDAVILADFAATRLSKKAKRASESLKQGCIVDLGTGSGIIPLILSAKTEANRIVGVELQQASYCRAKRNAALNGLEERLSFINADVKNISASKKSELPEAAEAQAFEALLGRVTAVTANPPYMPSCGGLTNSNSAKAIARHETTAGLWDFFAAAAALLKPKGDLFMVHRPSRLADICCFARENGLEPKELRFVSPGVRKAANIVLIHCVKNGGKDLRLSEPLFIYEEDGSYTDELRQCYL